MEFRSSHENPFNVWISATSLETMKAAAATAGRKETGGILIGRYGSDGWSADVVEATPSPVGSRAGFSWFVRSNKGLVDLLRQRWRKGFHYLGEWHLHPDASPVPSPTDKRTMCRIAADPAYQCSRPILIILGGSARSSFTLSVSVFDKRHEVALFPAETRSSNSTSLPLALDV